MREVLFVAGEPSGDLHGAGVAAELRRRAPDLPLGGIGGARMEAAGVALIEHTDRLAVMGFLEVLAHIPKHWKLLAEIKAKLRSGKIGLVILLDYPGFNMKVAAAAKAAGVPVLYYITPQVWAWGAKRLTELSFTIITCRVHPAVRGEMLRKAGIDATFVSHPLLDRASALPSRDEARRTLGLEGDAPVLALFPGSRKSEIARHLAIFVATARELQRRTPGLRVIVSVAPGDHPAGGGVSVPAGAREFVHRVARGRRGAVEERHVDARGGGGRMPARRGVQDERCDVRDRAARGVHPAHRVGERRRGPAGGAGVRAARRAAGRDGECAGAAARSHERRTRSHGAGAR